MEILIANQWIDPYGGHNEAPLVREIYEFMILHPDAKVGGDAIGQPREDYRVTIDSLSIRGVLTPGAEDDFAKLVGIKGSYMWWD